jgi:hypothetical protein
MILLMFAVFTLAADRNPVESGTLVILDETPANIGLDCRIAQIGYCPLEVFRRCSMRVFQH